MSLLRSKGRAILAGGVGQWVMVLAVKPDNLSLSLGSLGQKFLAFGQKQTNMRPVT